MIACAGRSGRVGRSLDWGIEGLLVRVASSSLTAGLVLVKPRKTRPDMTEKVLTGA